MERFELAKSEAEREEDYKRIVDHFRKMGITEDWKVSSLIKEEQRDFGLNKVFPQLTKEEDSKREELFDLRATVIEKYKQIREALEPLLEEERNIWSSLEDLNNNICEIEGHRLSEKSEEDVEYEGYTRISNGYYRECLICGKRIYKRDLTDKDAVVKGESGPKRIMFYKRNN